MQHLLAALPKPASAPKAQAPAQARGGKSSEALRREEARSAAAGSSGERAERRAGAPGSGAEGDDARLAPASVSGKSDRDDAASGRSDRDDAAASGKSDRDDARAVSGKSDRDDAASGRSDRDDLRAASGRSDRDNASSGTPERDDAVSAASGRSLRGDARTASGKSRRDDARAASGKSGGPGSAPGLSLADAIRRATSPLARLNGLPGDEAPQARRAPPLRPGKDDGADSDEVLDEAEDTPLASLQERLRDVRVGPGPGAPAVAAEAKSRFAKLAKGEAGAELTLAQQLGLKVKRVIVDAGHGGHDTGAIGTKGPREKDVSLAIAKKLGEKLEALGLEVVLTRDDDTFVKLEDRTRFANREKGDLFISIHCNAAPSAKLRGIETYSLNTSSNRYAIRLAARENATTERGVGDLQYILADLATKANTGESTRLAERVQQTLVRNLSGSYKDVKNLGHKEALFFVLLGARMPAVLVETSFLSNEEEEARLSDEAYQQSVADSIAEAVQGFLEERSRLAQVD
ncbi:MAG: N-acetylmuramoyl-L-alanine amidase [Myxococcales bacterium]|nr:N-acetylmuramoyl-L-alanine amidase [Myxococcales bacterium]